VFDRKLFSEIGFIVGRNFC